MSGGVLIIGGGQAAGQLAINLRNRGYDAPVTLVCAEPHLPYQRPPLSKGVLTGDGETERVFLRDAAWYAEENVSVRTGIAAQAIDPDAHRVRLANGEELGYAQLVLATGSRQRPLPVPGAGLDGVLSLRTLDDALRLRERLAESSRLVVVGGGFIGMEVAASARQRGCEVDVVELFPRVLARVVSEPMSAMVAAHHRAQGVRIHTSSTVTALTGDARVRAVQLEGGEAIEADSVLIAIGVQPEVTLAETAGLAVEDGIRVDAACRSSHPDIFAIGDCTRFAHPRYGSVRLESVANAMGQARTVAGVIVDGDGRYDEVPTFWTDQFDLRLQMGGLAEAGNETVVRGTPGEPGFAVLFLDGGELRAAEVLNDARAFMALRRILGGQAQATAAQLRDPGLPLAELAGTKRRQPA